MTRTSVTLRLLMAVGPLVRSGRPSFAHPPQPRAEWRRIWRFSPGSATTRAQLAHPFLDTAQAVTHIRASIGRRTNDPANQGRLSPDSGILDMRRRDFLAA